MNERNPLFNYLPVLGAMLFWSFSFIWYKEVFQYYHPFTLIVFRLVLAVPLLFILSIIFRKVQKIKRIHIGMFLLLALFEPFLYFIGECFGVKFISPTLAAIIISLIPLIAPIPAWYLFREKFTFTNFVGLIISVAGVSLVILGEDGLRISSFTGALLMLLAVFSAVCHSVFVRKLSAYYNTFTIVTYQSLFGLIYFIPLFILTELKEFLSTHHTFQMVFPVIKLAVFASTFAFLLFVYSIQKLGMARTNVFVNLIPVFTALLAFLILHEQFSVMKIIGIVVVISGLIFSQYNHHLRSSGKLS